MRRSGDPVCAACGDTHRVHVEDHGERMCTRCPTPCQKCRAGGNGPYCEHTPCGCECHGQHHQYRDGGVAGRRDVRAKAISLISRENVLALEAHGLVVVRTERLEALVAGADATLEAAAKRFQGPVAYVVFAGHEVAATLRTMKGGG